MGNNPQSYIRTRGHDGHSPAKMMDINLFDIDEVRFNSNTSGVAGFTPGQNKTNVEIECGSATYFHLVEPDWNYRNFLLNTYYFSRQSPQRYHFDYPNQQFIEFPTSNATSHRLINIQHVEFELDSDHVYALFDGKKIPVADGSDAKLSYDKLIQLQQILKQRFY